MREILFRGKLVYNGWWVEGGFYKEPKDDIKDGLSYIITASLSYAGNAEQVHQETVGQFTGLVDRNGKRVFEGDILQWVDEDNTCEGTKLIFIVKFDGEYEGFFGEGEFDNIEPWQFRSHEIIGNIHDNKMEDIK